MRLITETLAEQPKLLYCVDEEKAKVVLRNEAFIIVTEKIKSEEMKKLEKTKGGTEKMAWVKYDDTMKQKCLDLLKQGRKIREVVQMVNGPKKKAVMRWARKEGISYKC